MKAFFDSLIAYLRSSKKTILQVLVVAVVAILLITSISIWLNRFGNLHVPSIGTIKTLGVEVYWDENLENRTTEVYWGTIYPGDLIPLDRLYVRSISNSNTTLHLGTANWTFRDADDNIVSQPDSYMNLTWDYDEALVQPDEVVQVTLTLSVSSFSDFIYYLVANDVTTFSFDILIWASEHSS